MKKEEWLEYFEAVNGRQATNADMEAALAAGDFVEEVDVDSVESHEPLEKEVPQAQHIQDAAGVTSPQEPVYEPFAQGAAFNQQQAPQQGFHQGGMPNGQFQHAGFHQTGMPNGAFQQQGFNQAGMPNGAFQQTGFNQGGMLNGQYQQEGFDQTGMPNGQFQQEGNYQQQGPYQQNPFPPYQQANPFTFDVEASKEKVNHYWKWLVDAWSKPSRKVEASMTYNGITFGLLSFLFGLSLLWVGSSFAANATNGLNYFISFVPRTRASDLIGHFGIREYFTITIVAALFLFGFILSSFVARYVIYGESSYTLKESFNWYGRHWSILIPVLTGVSLFAFIGLADFAGFFWILSLIFLLLMAGYSLLNSPKNKTLDAAYIYTIAYGVVAIVLVIITIINVQFIQSIVRSLYNF